jgi:predicted phosphodiesterase
LGNEWNEKNCQRKNFNALVFGHTHKPFVKEERGFLFINPGSLTNPLPPLLAKPSVRLLKITKEKIEPMIFRF